MYVEVNIMIDKNYVNVFNIENILLSEYML
jgi:hypothetical protein